MNTILEQVDAGAGLSDQCRQFGNILGLDEAVPEKVFLAALQNETYARNLLLSKDSPEMLAQLMENPAMPRTGGKEYSNLELIGKAAGALLRWGKTGFTKAGKEVIGRREEACLACPHLRDPKGLLQNLVPSAGLTEESGYRTGKKVCGLCGCNVSNKIRMTSESCPERHPEDNSMTRWGEPAHK
jgi:hypothetical protein